MLKKLVLTVQNLKPTFSWAIPAILFAACFFSHGILLSSLGYFQDDWHHVYYAYHEGADGLKNFFFTDSRPFAYFIYKYLFSFSGFTPEHWHWSLMILRFLTSLVAWLLFRQIWPQKEEFTGWLALFFALHPVFTLQPLAVAYSLHWVSYLVLISSFILMALAIKKKQQFWPLTISAITLQVFHLLMMEYYAGLEIFRVLIIWMILPESSWHNKIKKTFLTWLPYLLILGLYAAYRLSYNKIFGYDRFETVVLTGLFTSPIQTLSTLLESLIQDLIFIMVSPWYSAISPSVFDLERLSTWAMMMGGILFAGIFYFAFSQTRKGMTQEQEYRHPILVIFYGFVSLTLGMLPTWAIGFSMFTKNPLWSSRFALPAILGASLFTVGLVYFFFQEVRRRTFILSLLLGVAVFSHIQIARDFNLSWEKQLRLYWQLHWRAPSLEPGTLIAADSEILPYMGDSPTAYAINLIYPKTYISPQTDYWFSPGSKDVPDSFFKGQPTEISKYSSVFSASPKKVIAIIFEPEQGQCLWFLRPSYREIRFLSDEAYRWMAISNLSLAKESPVTLPPPASIFGYEPAHTWCYYYQKADLAAHEQNWERVLLLWDEAKEQNYGPANGVEMLPFIEAYAHLSNWNQAQKLTFQANTLPPRMSSLLCTVWQSFEQTYPDKSAQNIISETQAKLKCQQ